MKIYDNIFFKKRIIARIALVIISTVVALLVAECSLRLLKTGYGNLPQESDKIFHHVHPSEYKFVYYNPRYKYGGHKVYYDENGLIADPNRAYSKRDTSTSAHRVAFLGDSFTEALQVPYEDSFVGILSGNSECEIRNYGVSSYSPIFYLLQWRKIVKKFEPSLVVVQIYSNDISSDRIYIEKAKKDDDGQVIAIPGPGEGLIRNQLRKSYLMRLLRKTQLQLLWKYENRGNPPNIVEGVVEENPDISRLSARLIMTLANEVRESGAQFIFTVVPSRARIIQGKDNDKTPSFSEKWKMFAQENDIPFLDLTMPFERESKKGFELFFDGDIHFNKNGHIIVASELAKTYPNLFNPVKKPLIKY